VTKRKSHVPKKPATCKVLTIDLPPAVWTLTRQLQRLINVQRRRKKKQPMNLSGVASLILLDALLQNNRDIQDEYEEVGVAQLALRLAPIIGADGLAAAGFPESMAVPNGGGTPRAGRPFKDFF